MVGEGAAWIEVKEALRIHAGMSETTSARMAERLMPQRTPELVPPVATGDRPSSSPQEPTDTQLPSEPAPGLSIEEVDRRIAEAQASIRKQLIERDARAKKAQEDSDELLATVQAMKAQTAAIEAAQARQPTVVPRRSPWPVAALAATLLTAGWAWRAGSVEAAPRTLDSISHVYKGVIPVDGSPARQSEVDGEHAYTTYQNPEESDEEWHDRHFAEVDRFRRLLLTQD